MGNLADLRDKTAIVGVGNTDFGAMYRNLDPAMTVWHVVPKEAPTWVRPTTTTLSTFSL